MRRPRGYFGEDHTTLGSDILTVLKILRLPEQVLGKEESDRLKHVRPDGWYPVEQMLGLMEILEAHVGNYGLMQLGRRLFEAHKPRILLSAKTARDILYGFDNMYHQTNRGSGIGGWQVLRFDPGFAQVENNTPHHCIVEHGMLTEALLAVGSACNVSQKRCFREGADTCIFEITSAFVDSRWSADAKR
jgi:hypothetical protein